jgi:VIT1/CCC1 family predicted Fe2+/Mn2+ transporter
MHTDGVMKGRYMMADSLSPSLYKLILKMQRSELDGCILYAQIAKRQKKQSNKSAMIEIAKTERRHYEIWRRYTGRDLQPSRLKIAFFRVLSRVLGDTFTIKFFERSEDRGIKDLKSVEDDLPEARAIIKEEEGHEAQLIEMIDEERLHYVGSMVLGLNDALVELTGAVAGLTFALANTRLVALSAIITGVSATLSMAASNYLAERADGNAKALKSSMYTGVAYLITVVLMVTPYLLLPNSLYIAAFGVMLTVVILVILVFNYYISVAQGLPFLRRFGEMATISLGVAAISFVIGLLAKSLLGISV